MDNSVISIDPNTLQTSQTVFDGTQNVDTTSPAPLTGQPQGLNVLGLFQQASTQQLGNWFQQAQQMIEQNPGLAALLGLGVLIIAANSGQKKK